MSTNSTGEQLTYAQVWAAMGEPAQWAIPRQGPFPGGDPCRSKGWHPALGQETCER
jgi:hypothetical protein